MDAFAAVILGLLAVGIVAVACVLPYQGLRDADGDGHRWQVTLARWSIARDYPVVSSLAGYAERAERGGGIEAYLPEADTTNEVFSRGWGRRLRRTISTTRTRRIWKISTRGR